MRPTFIDRVRFSLLQLLISIDQLVATLIKMPIYIVFAIGRPNADETISSIVGRNAILQKRWALIAERIINPVFALLGDPDHCRMAIEIFPRH